MMIIFNTNICVSGTTGKDILNTLVIYSHENHMSVKQEKILVSE